MRNVAYILQALQLVTIQNSLVGGVARRGISGGQRKRVNIGYELVALPALLFADEPTSGAARLQPVPSATAWHKAALFAIVSVSVSIRCSSFDESTQVQPPGTALIELCCHSQATLPVETVLVWHNQNILSRGSSPKQTLAVPLVK